MKLTHLAHAILRLSEVVGAFLRDLEEGLGGRGVSHGGAVGGVVETVDWYEEAAGADGGVEVGER